MKAFLTFLMISISLAAFSQATQSLNLKLTGDLYYSREPSGNAKGIRITVKNKFQTVLLVATDNSNNRRLNPNESFLNGKGRPAFLASIPQLYDMKDNGTSKSFLYGKNSAENNLDDAVVNVFYGNAAPTPGGSMNRKPLNFDIQPSEVFIVTASGSQGDISGKPFLKVEASAGQTATIEINREESRGNVIVAIFSQQTGNLLATLNPKDPANPASRLAFTTDETVMVVPFIRPSVTTASGTDTISFSVGDPVENASAESIEE